MRDEIRSYPRFLSPFLTSKLSGVFTSRHASYIAPLSIGFSSWRASPPECTLFANTFPVCTSGTRPNFSFAATSTALATFALLSLGLGTSVWGQLPPSPTNTGISNYVPVAAGGLPPGANGLEQPVFVTARENMSSGVSSQDYANFLGADLPGSNPPGNSQSRANLSIETPPTTFNAFNTDPASISGFDSTPEPEIVFEEFRAANRIAVVGTEPILLGNVIDPSKLKNIKPSTPGFEEFLRKELGNVIVRKALYQRFFNQQVAGKAAKDRETARAQINKKTAEMFHKDALPEIAKSMGLETVEQFVEQLAKEGKTLQSIQQSWTEGVIASECKRSSIDTDPKIELPEMREYYEDNIEEFRRRARVRFEILTAEFAKHPNRQAAYDAVAEMGNQVYFGNALEAVAKKFSSGFAASSGGKVDWTSKGALKSKVIDEAIFSLPLNKLSDIIEDSDSYHIIRVVEREDERVLPFEDVQGEIKKKLAAMKVEKAEKEFVETVLKETPIWTRWPEDFPDAMSIDMLDL